MNPKTLFRLFLSLTLALIASGQGKGRQPCDITDQRIICRGSSLTDSILLSLKDELHLRFNHMYFLELHISDTELTRIPSGTFADVQFENIYIQDNHLLTQIAEDAFAKQNARSLFIINNAQLKDNSVYKITDTLHVTELVDLDFNALVEVPSNAFNEHLPAVGAFYSKSHSDESDSDKSDQNSEIRNQKVAQASAAVAGVVPKKVNFKKLVMSNNQIERINSNAFHLLQSCNQIFLNYNKLQHIQSKGFNLVDHLGSTGSGSGENDLHLTIRLDSNRLTKDSFEPDFISMNNHTNLLVDLTQNQITELKQNVFRPLLEAHSIMVDLSGNPVDCHAIEWLKLEPKLLLKTKGINC